MGAPAATLHHQRGQQRGLRGQILIAGTGSVGAKELDEVGVVGLAHALEVEDLAEVGVGFVGDVDEVGLHEGFGWRGPHLQGLEERVEPGHGCGDSFEVAGGGGDTGRGGEGDELFEAFFQYVGVKEHL